MVAGLAARRVPQHTVGGRRRYFVLSCRTIQAMDARTATQVLYLYALSYTRGSHVLLYSRALYFRTPFVVPET